MTAGLLVTLVGATVTGVAMIAAAAVAISDPLLRSPGRRRAVTVGLAVASVAVLTMLIGVVLGAFAVGNAIVEFW